MEKYDGLEMIRMHKGQKSQCGYTWLVQTACFAHTAYRTKEGMRKFLDDTGLKIARAGWCSHSRNLTGCYYRNMMMDELKFAEMKASGNYRITNTLSNGAYTTALIEERADGNIIHYLNPNCNREIHPYIHD